MCCAAKFFAVSDNIRGILGVSACSNDDDDIAGDGNDVIDPVLNIHSGDDVDGDWLVGDWCFAECVDWSLCCRCN